MLELYSYIVNKLDIKNETLRQSIKYLFVGGSCTVLDFCILFVGSELLGFNYMYVSAFSFMCGVILNYFLCIYWIFRVHVVEKHTMEFGFYLLISLIGLLINSGVIYIATGIFGLYLMFSKLLSAFITYFWNFFARKYLLHFKK